MKKIILILICFLPLSSFAEDDVRVQLIDGKKFVCFDEVVSKDLFQLRLDYPKLQSKILILEEKVEVQKNMIKSLEDAGTALSEQNAILESTNAALEEKLIDGEKWYKSPYFLVTLGIVLGVGLSVGIMYAVK